MSSDAGGGTRPRRRFSPARQVLTLYGDYWWDAGEPLPSGALIAALGDLGVKEAAARATLSRLTKLGLLHSARAGRRTTHRLTDRARATIADEARWLRAFGRIEPQWDGLWSVLAFTIPETQRALRHTARSRLRWLGYAPLHDGVWISPLDTAADALDALRELRVGDITSMRARLETSIEGGPQSAWNLDAVDAAYRAFTATIRDTAPTTAAEALAERSALMLEWQRFRGLDAGLPPEVLPPDWPRADARRRFAARYDELGEAAEERMRAHVRAIAPELAPLVQGHRLSIPRHSTSG